MKTWPNKKLVVVEELKPSYHIAETKLFTEYPWYDEKYPNTGYVGFLKWEL